MTALDFFPTVDEQAERNVAAVRRFAADRGLLFEGDAYAWAVFSPDRAYRYLLGRQWDPDGVCMRWIMLNPSTAGATGDDPTSRKVRGFSDRRAGSYVIANIGALGLLQTQRDEAREELAHRGVWPAQAPCLATHDGSDGE